MFSGRGKNGGEKDLQARPPPNPDFDHLSLSRAPKCLSLPLWPTNNVAPAEIAWFPPGAMSASHSKLSADLKSLLEQASTDEVQLGEAFDRMGEKGFGLLLVVLSLPSALPLPAAGYSVPFGIVLAILALQMIAGKTSPVLPKAAQKAKLGSGFARKMLGAAEWFFSKVERFIRPRFSFMIGRGGKTFMGILVLLMAILMIIPIPTTNTAPAMVIFLIGVGLTEEDGLFSLMACVLGVMAILFYSVLVYLIFIYGLEAADMVKEWIKGHMGMEPSPEPAG